MSRTLIAGITNRILLLIAAGLLALSYLSAFVNPAQAWLFVIPGLMYLPLALLNLFLLVWALLRRSKAFLIPLIALLPTVFFLGRYFQAADNGSGYNDETQYNGAAGNAGSESIRLLSYNVGRFMMEKTGRQGTTIKENMDSIFDFIKKENADIVCLQEFYTKDNNSVKASLSEDFPGYQIEYYIYTGKFGKFGNVILSKLPVLDKGVIKFDRSKNLAIFADVLADGKKLRVYNCHFESYNISFPGIIKSVTEKKTEIFEETERKVKKSLSLRPRQVDQVLNHIESCDIETVLCGDFNDNPMSYTYQKLIKGHKDTFSEAGKGFGATYSILWPLLRIDYIFSPDSYGPIRYRCPKVGYSDHYPVIADITQYKPMDMIY